MSIEYKNKYIQLNGTILLPRSQHQYLYHSLKEVDICIDNVETWEKKGSVEIFCIRGLVVNSLNSIHT